MKKEKTIRTYQRRTKTGKVVTVKQHTAKYDAAEALKEAAKKKGAGDELEALKKKPKTTPLEDSLEDLFTKEDWLAANDEGDDKAARRIDKAVKSYLGKAYSAYDDYIDQTAQSGSSYKKDLKAIEMAKNGYKYYKNKWVKPDGVPSEVSKAPKEAKAPKETKSAGSGVGFTADEYKAWYHWDQDADPKNAAAKKVEKALKAKMGAKGYKKYFDEMTDNYSSRGHNKAFKGLSDTLSAGAEKKTSTSGKESKSQLTKEIAQQDKYVKHLMRLHKDGIKDKQMGSYIAAEQKILNDLKKHKGDYEKRDLDSIEKNFAKKSKLSYMEDGLYRGKDGKVYRISVHPLTGEATLHSMTGVSTGEKKSSKPPRKNANDSDLVEHYDQFNKKHMGKAVGDSFTFSEGRGKDKVTYDARFVTDGRGRYGYVVRDKAEGPSAKYYVGISDGYGLPGSLPTGLRKAAEAQGLRFKGGEFVKESGAKGKDSSKSSEESKGSKKTLSWKRDAEVQDERDLANKRRAEASSAKDVKEWAKANKYHLKKNGLYAKGLGKGTHSVDDLRKLMRSSDSGGSSKSKNSKISDSSLKAKGYVSFKDYGTTLYIGKKGKAVYMKTPKGIVKADRDDYADFVTGHNGLSKANRKKLESLGWHEHEEY